MRTGDRLESAESISARSSLATSTGSPRAFVRRVASSSGISGRRSWTRETCPGPVSPPGEQCLKRIDRDGTGGSITASNSLATANFRGIFHRGQAALQGSGKMSGQNMRLVCRVDLGGIDLHVQNRLESQFEIFGDDALQASLRPWPEMHPLAELAKWIGLGPEIRAMTENGLLRSPPLRGGSSGQLDLASGWSACPFTIRAHRRKVGAGQRAALHQGEVEMTATVSRFEPRVAPCRQVSAGEQFVTEDLQGLTTADLRYDCGCREYQGAVPRRQRPRQGGGPPRQGPDGRAFRGE